jgi:hypothetical protein
MPGRLEFRLAGFPGAALRGVPGRAQVPGRGPVSGHGRGERRGRRAESGGGRNNWRVVRVLGIVSGMGGAG